MATAFRRAQVLQHRDKTLQDYVVTPNQLWLDGIALEPGVVRQFTAVPMGSGYSVEAQLSGEEITGGIQIEVTATKTFSIQQSKDSIQVLVTKMSGDKSKILCSATDTVLELKDEIAETEGIPADQQRLTHKGKILDDKYTLRSYGIKNKSPILLSLKLTGGSLRRAQAVRNTRMAIAAGGRIRQCIQKDTVPFEAWAPETTTVFPVHILDCGQFLSITGIEPPTTPITVESYKEAGLPFFHLEEPESDVHGKNLQSVLSAKQMDNTKTIQKGFQPEEEDSVVKPRVIPIKALRYTVTPNHKGPYQKFRTASELEEVTRTMRIASFNDDTDTDMFKG
ncbi:MAG: hypothetical protein Q9227_004955 [Pyrenula ochraceoflavens]